MPKKIYLHVGRPKTGSTAIQHFLFCNQAALMRQGVCYPTEIFCHNQLAADLGHLFNGDVNKLRSRSQQSLALIHDAPADRVIVSSEQLSSHTKHLAALVSQLGEEHDYQVIIYLRRWDHALMASYNQRVKRNHRREKKSLRAFVRAYEVEVQGHIDQLYRWRDFFGSENVTLRPYEKQQDPFWLFKDFLKCIHVNYTDDFILPPPSKGNESIPFETIKKLRWVNYLPMPNVVSKMVKYCICAYDQKYLTPQQKKCRGRLPAELSEALLKHYQEAEARIARDFLGKDSGRLWEEP